MLSATSVAASGGALRSGTKALIETVGLISGTAGAVSAGGRLVGVAADVYRVHGGTAGPTGSFWTRTQPAGPLQARIDLGLPPEWGNTATQVARINVPPGTTIYEAWPRRMEDWSVAGAKCTFLRWIRHG